MVSGWNNGGLELGIENEGSNGATNTRLVDEWNNDPNSNSNSKSEEGSLTRLPSFSKGGILENF